MSERDMVSSNPAPVKNVDQHSGLSGRREEREDPRAVLDALGPGSAMDQGVKVSMESAFDMDFSGVRTHTDPQAAALSCHLNARAFTVGNHIAFGNGQYRPGTLEGDALIAHELAHVTQQRGSQDNVQPLQTGAAQNHALEADAHRSAANATASIWSHLGHGVSRIKDTVMPRLRSGLNISRCPKSQTVKPTKPFSKPSAKPAAKPAATSAAKPAAKSGSGQACPVATDVKIKTIKQQIVNTFKIGGFIKEGSPGSPPCWTLEELVIVQRALGRLKPWQLKEIEGVKFKRVKTASCDSSASGCFQPVLEKTGKRKDFIEISDRAFEFDKDYKGPKPTKRYDAARKRVTALPSEDTLTHEVGHAVETGALRKAQAAEQKADIVDSAKHKALKAAITKFNKIPYTRISGYSYANRFERNYFRRLEAAQHSLSTASNSFTKAKLDKLSSRGYSKLIKRMKPKLKNADKAVKKRIAARKALESRYPDTSKPLDDVEDTQKEFLTALQNVYTALIGKRDALKVLERKRKALRKVSGQIVVGSKVLETSKLLAEMVAIIHIRKVNVKGSTVGASFISDHAKKNWPDKPDEVFADLFQLSVIQPASLKAVHSDLAAFFKHPIGVKGRRLKRLVRKRLSKWRRKASTIKKKQAARKKSSKGNP